MKLEVHKLDAFYGRAQILFGVTLKVAADNPGMFKALVLLDPIVFPGPVWLAMRAMASVRISSEVAVEMRKKGERP